jgi:hypothetical protein
MDFRTGSTTRARIATSTLGAPARKGARKPPTLPFGGVFNAPRTLLALAAREPDLPGHGPNPPAGAAYFGPLQRAKVSDTDIDLRYRPAASVSWAVGGRPKT